MKGQGAFLNNTPIKVSAKSQLRSALAATAHAGKMVEEFANTGKFVQNIKTLTGLVAAIRVLGPASLQLAYVACGRIDAYSEHGKDIHDRIGAALLVTEAGGIVKSAPGATFDFNSGSIVASNPLLIENMLRAV
ncbi:MAG: inositol monophosphatase family protein [Niabella sp.]